MPAQLPEAVLAIWIKGHKKPVLQGKFFYLAGKPHYVANMTSNKEWRNYSGYAISARILDALPRGAKIIYKRLDLNLYYLANKNRFRHKGILVKYGFHSQWVLPAKNWGVHAGRFEGESQNLPVMELGKWLSYKQKKEERPIVEDFTIPDEVRFGLKTIWDQKYA